MAAIMYNRGKFRIANGTTKLDGTGDLRMLLIITSKTGADEPDLDTVADLDAVGTVAIHSERVALTGESLTQDDTNNRFNADANTVAFAVSAGVSALACVIYDEAGGTDATRHLLMFDDTNFGAGKSLDGGLNVNIAADYLRGS